MARGKQRSVDEAEDLEYDWHYLCKFILIGDSSVGKSALLLRVTDDRFLAEETEPTIGVEFGSVAIPLPSSSAGSSSSSASGSSSTPPERVKIQIWDTAGSEAFRGITRSYYRGAAGCLLVYDVTHRPSFLNAKGWLKDVRENAEEEACIVLVGNRVDLVEADDSKRKVSTEEAKQWVEQEGILFLETSAKTGQNVVPAFEQCVTEIHRRFTASQAALSASSQQKSGARQNSTSGASLLKSRTGPGGSGGSVEGRSGLSGSGGEIRIDGRDSEVSRGCCIVM